MQTIVLTVDQRRSRSNADAVPQALRLLDDVPTLRQPERTAGDEFQALVESADGLATAIERLLRDGRWHIGIGIDEVEHPLPPTTRAGRGAAFLAARTAVTAAHTAPHHLRVSGPGQWVRHLESALWLWAGLLERRTPKGWEVADLAADGLTHDAIAERLTISQSAVSQRAAAAALVDAARARELVVALTVEAQTGAALTVEAQTVAAQTVTETDAGDDR
ncbi:transposase [Nocardioides gilvus]|uniref:transposase n=1 Tax=Nocardioides gilvus TaxID=1735589 RepID=UPI0019520ECE|nr:transposase [Nocardioides gilvus]